MSSKVTSRVLRFQDRLRASLTMTGSLVALSGCGEVIFTDLESTGGSEPPPTYSWAQDVNDGGLVVGGAGPPYYPVKFVDGAAVALPTPPLATDCLVRAAGNGGELVGYCNYGWVTRAYLWKPDGTIATLGDDITPEDVNSAGIVVGIRTRNGSNAAVVYDPAVGEVVVLPIPADMKGSLAIGINDAGDIVGQADTDNVGGGVYSPYAVIWSGAERTMKTLPRRDDCGGQATAINNHGVIGGRDCGRPVLWQTADSLPEQLSAPPPTPTGYFEVVDVNDRGEAVGHFVPISGHFSRYGMGWTSGHKLVNFAPATAFGINNSGVTVGERNGRAVQIDWL